VLEEGFSFYELTNTFDRCRIDDIFITSCKIMSYSMYRKRRFDIFDLVDLLFRLLWRGIVWLYRFIKRKLYDK